MTYYPTKSEFVSTHKAGKAQLVWYRLVADTETPVSAMLKLHSEGKPCFLLESVEGGEVRGRYSIIGLEPDIIWRCRGHEADICRNITIDNKLNFTLCDKPSIPALKSLIAESQLDIPEELPPMAAGLIGYMGYDMIKLIEDIPSNNPDPINIPDSVLMRPSITVIFDARDGVIYIVTPVWQAEGSAENAYSEACAKIDDVLNKLSNSLTPQPLNTMSVANELTFQPNMSNADYHVMVTKAQEYILAGDIFQCVPSQRFSTTFDLPPLALYRSLRHLNPSPFLFYLHLEDFALVGSSPEILVRVRDDKITIRPIAGTRKRGETLKEDNALEQELLADPKEIAEHLMLLDLGRNDVGKCAKTGTVKVTEEMLVERYSHVMHIVSNVEGDLDDNKYDCFDALMSGFPAGTVSGAPKIRAMQIIDELESEARSFYAGCVGYFSANGSMDSCITLRTGLIKDETLHVQAGGGVVVDSDPEAEYQESCNKAKAIMKAAEQAGNFIHRTNR